LPSLASQAERGAPFPVDR